MTEYRRVATQIIDKVLNMVLTINQDTYTDGRRTIMTKYQKVAAEIIDSVLEVVEDANKDISTVGREGNTLLYGEPYYDLENEVSTMLKNLILEVFRETTEHLDKDEDI